MRWTDHVPLGNWSLFPTSLALLFCNTVDTQSLSMLLSCNW